MASFDPLHQFSSRQPGSILGKLEHVDPRTVWAHEAQHFTPWLATQGDRLSEALGIDLELSGSEYPVGEFSLDLIGRDLTHDAPLTNPKVSRATSLEDVSEGGVTEEALHYSRQPLQAM
jgi:hypothetical protein